MKILVGRIAKAQFHAPGAPQAIDHGHLLLVSNLAHDQKAGSALSETLPGIGQEVVALVGTDESHGAEQATVLLDPEPAARLVSVHALAR